MAGNALLLAALVGSGIMAQRLAAGNVALALLCNTFATGALELLAGIVPALVSGGIAAGAAGLPIVPCVLALGLVWYAAEASRRIAAFVRFYQYDERAFSAATIRRRSRDPQSRRSRRSGEEAGSLMTEKYNCIGVL